MVATSSGPAHNFDERASSSNAEQMRLVTLKCIIIMRGEQCFPGMFVVGGEGMRAREGEWPPVDKRKGC